VTRNTLIAALTDIGGKLPRETALESMNQLLTAFQVGAVSELQVSQYDAVLQAAQQMLAQSTH
jgi:hypothetical protein